LSTKNACQNHAGCQVEAVVISFSIQTRTDILNFRACRISGSSLSFTPRAMKKFRLESAAVRQCFAWRLCVWQSHYQPYIHIYTRLYVGLHICA